jgi:bacterioferritin-associated ferredoxin
MRTGCGATCGSCLETAATLLEPARAEREARFSLPVLDISHAA